MIRLFTFCFSILYCSVLQAQSLYSTIQRDRPEYKTVRPEKIIATNIFYGSSGKKIERSIMLFEAGMLAQVERYDKDDKLIFKLTCTNDTIHRRRLSSYSEHLTSIGINKETTVFEYDSKGFLIKEIYQDAYRTMYQYADIVNNENGDPVKFTLYDKSGSPFGTECAEYLYDQNKYVKTAYHPDGRKLLTDTATLNFENGSKFPKEGVTYNEHGDALTSTTKQFNGTEVNYDYEYNYDSFGNCTEMRIFEVTIKSNGKRKRKADRIFKKEYTYQ
ncbi:hypothetical protein HHL16_21370 [Pseudoflavitalea sp. G-6-1-2]|uniref:hypothetical protein n=1 Tax=Pseudoflavitalea sp. G-6-1-2 TaxID=2728841 RepID=UPI00146C85E5|nr:hypothetical protein [Pseudoflavitalea sp. G-6-1-2]NML23444.1 hypothetical protein [Pseudoflavitalea sp. G-6-1-2]